MTEDSSNLRKTSSMDEWRNYGERLTRLHHELVTLLVDAGKTVPRSELEDLEKALERVDTARSDLEGRMTREHDPDEWDLDVFYGGIPEDYTGWREILRSELSENSEKIATHDGGYVALPRPDGRSSAKKITNFQLEVREFIQDDTGFKVALTVHPAEKGRKYDVTVPITVFNGVRSFENAVVTGRTTLFRGTMSDLNDLREFVGSQDVPVREVTQ